MDGKSPRPAVAVLLTLLVPGLGHLYAARPAWFFLGLFGVPLTVLLTIFGMFHLSDGTHPWMEWQREYLALSDSAGIGAYAPTLLTWGPISVPSGSVFVLGDHRNLSMDSRFRGFVGVDEVTGFPHRVYFSFDSERSAVRWSRLGQEIR